MRNRYVAYLSIAALFILFTTFYYRTGGPLENIQNNTRVRPPSANPESAPAPPPYKPRYKKAPTTKSPPIVDNFPLANNARSPADLPPVPIWNTPPTPHVNESTPLLIGFTRNWRLLQQVVVSYITSGWPAEDIYVVENTGVMDSNKLGLLSLQNPFFLNHTRLNVLGVNVVITPTLLTFAQLQNFYIYEATQRGWQHFFWSHMDVVAVSFEDQYGAKYPDIKPGHDYSDFTSLYKNCLGTLRDVLTPDATTARLKRWAQRFFSYDRLALVNVQAFKDVGAWDTLIPFYMTDCDMHARLEMAGYIVEEVHPGMVFDVASSLEDVVVLYRHTGPGVGEVAWKDPNAPPPKEVKAGDGHEKRRVGKRTGYPGNETESERWMDFPAGSPKKSGTYADEAIEEVEHSSTSTSPLVTTVQPSLSTSTSLTLPLSSSLAELTTPTILSHTQSLYTPDPAHSPLFLSLLSILDRMQGSKGASPHGRNTWQSRQTGGLGDPFYRNPEGFEKGIAMTIEFGRTVFSEKWGHRDCDIAPIGMRPSDAWNVDHDWD